MSGISQRFRALNPVRKTLVVLSIGTFLFVCGSCIFISFFEEPTIITQPVTPRPEQAVQASAATKVPQSRPTIIPTATLVPTYTPTPEPTSTPTPEPTNTPTLPPAKATAQAKQDATATVIALEGQYPEIDVRDLAKGPDRYRDQKLRLTGTVFNVQEGQGGFLGLEGTVTTMQIWVQIPGGNQFNREAITVEFSGTLEGVYKDTEIIIYGVGAGTFEGTNAFGATVVQPLVKGEYVRW